MSQPWMLLAAIVALGLAYVLVPVFLLTYARLRAPRRLRCPVTGEKAAIRVDASRAALTDAVTGHPRLRVERCTLWPGRSGCGQECVAAFR